MREITPRLTSEIAKHVGEEGVWRSPGYGITSFRRLVEIVAELAYENSDHLFFFRGQARDYQSRSGGTSLYPTIYRGDPVSARELRRRFDLLDRASASLISRWRESKLAGFRDIHHRRYVQWSILQHYEVVDTPLLDITQSLRVACSFAQQSATNGECFVYVLGLPHITNRISINSEHELVNVRLLSICPPAALRPHFQEGYLAGTTDITFDFDSKTEMDFRNRLVAKFRIPSVASFWGRGFNSIPRDSLYPRGDSVLKLCEMLKAEISTGQEPGDLGQFIREWGELEETLIGRAGNLSSRNLSVGEAISILASRGEIPEYLAREFDSVRKFRNALVHRPDRIKDVEIEQALGRLRMAKANVK